MKRSFAWLAPVALVFSSAPAHAFTEDVCYVSGGGVTDCTPLPNACLPAGTDSPLCRQAAIAVYAASAAKYPNARSSIHVDGPFIVAQAVGFPAADAYWIAAYAEAVDRGDFEPLDENGNAVGGGTLKTASLTGMERTDFTSGGLLIHYSAPRNPDGPTPVPGANGLAPDVTDDVHEVLLSHLRSWAMAEVGPSRPDCAGGFTNAASGTTGATADYATGASCYANGAKPGAIIGSTTMLDGPRAEQNDADIQTFDVPTGLQIIQDTDAGQTTSDKFDEVVSTTNPSIVADARLAVYVHALGDRSSHHVCLDEGYMYGPEDAGTTFYQDTTNSDCAQGLHLLRHIWETGVDPTKLLAQDRTTAAYIGNLYDELVAFAKLRGVFKAGADDATTRQALISDLTTAYATSGADARLAALRNATCSRNLVAFPGETACPGTAALDPNATAPLEAPDAGANDGGGGDASTGANDGGGGDASTGPTGDASTGPAGDASTGPTSGSTLDAGMDGGAATADANDSSGGCAVGGDGGTVAGLGGFLTVAIALAFRARSRRR